jgi:hypothetical protein
VVDSAIESANHHRDRRCQSSTSRGDQANGEVTGERRFRSREVFLDPPLPATGAPRARISATHARLPSMAATSLTFRVAVAAPLRSAKPAARLGASAKVPARPDRVATRIIPSFLTTNAREG